MEKIYLIKIPELNLRFIGSYKTKGGLIYINWDSVAELKLKERFKKIFRFIPVIDYEWVWVKSKQSNPFITSVDKVKQIIKLKREVREQTK